MGTEHSGWAAWGEAYLATSRNLQNTPRGLGDAPSCAMLPASSQRVNTTGVHHTNGWSQFWALEDKPRSREGTHQLVRHLRLGHLKESLA